MICPLSLVLSFLVVVIMENPYSTAFSLEASSSSSSPKNPTIISNSNSIMGSITTAATISDESDFPKQVQIALEGVRKACVVTKKLQESLSTIETITKSDTSPVTVADFCAQAIVLKHLYANFPNDVFLAEESSDSLTLDATQQILSSLQKYYNNNNDDDGDDQNISNEQHLKECIDLGQTFFSQATTTTTTTTSKEKITESVPSARRVWCLDPIDGTKGFLRKEQYCVALALLEEGIPTIGILACPNLPFVFSDENNNNDGSDAAAAAAATTTTTTTTTTSSSAIGCIFVACKGGGCYQLPMEKNSIEKNDQGAGTTQQMMTIKKLEPSSSSTGKNYDIQKARFCVNVEQSFADPIGKCKQMAKLLHGSLKKKENGEEEILYSIRMDSQAKYGVVARGDAEFYVRLPKSDHREWIWDVAPGVVVLEEMGGVVTDTAGRPLDFSVGAKLASNGVLGARDATLHRALLEAYRQQ